jgi:hypothetical protein
MNSNLLINPYYDSCFIPLNFIPIHRKQIWLCPVCNWQVDADRGEPKRVGAPSQQQPGQYWSPSAGGPGGSSPQQQPGYGYGVGAGVTPSGIAGAYPGQGR